MKPTSSTLGIVAICKNEEADLPGFLKNLLPWVDEIVLVDDGSTDSTLEIARNAGPKVKVTSHQRSRETGGFSGQRNAGIDASASEWLLHMDIDERVTPELAREILASIQAARFDAFRYRRLNFFLHHAMSGGGFQTWNNVQLARRNIRFTGVIHERMDAPVHRTGQLCGMMWHLNDADYVERVRKNMTYMQVEAEKLESQGITIRWWHFVLPPLTRAIKAYFLRAGWRDGTIGLLSAVYTFSGTFNWYATAWDRQNRVPRASLEKEIADAWNERELTKTKDHKAD